MKSRIALVLYLFVNILFILKYSLRVFPFIWSALICLIYLLFIITVLKQQAVRYIKEKWLIPFILLVSTVLVLAQSKIDPYQIQVDRWSAIHNFLDYLFEGRYPYGAQTHLGGYGSPFPVWQLFHVPFYLFGNVGLSFLLATFLFFHAVYKLLGLKVMFYSFLLLILSPAFLYEVMVRSDLMSNFLIVCAIVCYIRKYQFSFSNHWLLLALLCGLIMSTRLSAVIPLIVYLFYDYLNARWSVRIMFSLLVLMTFIITFLPFLLWNGEMLFFFEYNPFILQSRQGNLSDFLLFIPIGIWLSLSWKGDFNRYALNTSILLILLVCVTFIHNMYLHGNWDELFASAYDITYFNMSLPFLMLALSSDDQY